MTVNKRKKNSRQRGHHTHGWGSKKKHRGSGNRGGFGMAGTGKRADHKKPSIIKEYGNSYFGKHGFNRPQEYLYKYNTVNLSYLQNNLNKFLDDKLIIKEGEFYLVDVSKLGYGKVLGGGKLNIRFRLKAEQVSKKAVTKIKEAGGEVESVRIQRDNK